MLLAFIKRFEQAIIAVLMILMVVVVVFSTLDLAKQILYEVASVPLLVLPAEKLLDLFGLFLLVLIGLELLEIIKSYALSTVVHVRVVVTVAMIAIARKVIILDVDERSSGSLLGIAGIIIALSIAHYVLRGNEVSHKT